MLKKRIDDFYLTAGQYESVPCKVPFSLISVLIGMGQMQDPTRYKNLLHTAEGIPDSATFRSEIYVTEAELAHKYAYLKLWGVYANAEIYFNGKNYGRIDTSDRLYLYDVSDILRVGKNELKIEVLGVVPEKRMLDSDGAISHEYAMAPYLPDMVIIGGCELINTSAAMISDVRVTQLHSGKLVTLMINVDTVGTDPDMRAIAMLRSPTGQIFYSGISMGNCVIDIKEPELWWPNGLGRANLYTLTVTLYHKGECADTYERKVGLREISVGTDANGVPAVVVNGHKIFSRGATYLRECAVLSQYNEKRTESILKSVRDANMNTLRVISEGVAPHDRFYELCDEYGILVWQDISVHYISPPIQGAFAAGITAALRDNVARATSHPSVAILYLSVTGMAGGDEPSGRAEIEEFREIAARILRPVLERYGSGVVFIPDLSDIVAHDERSICAKKYGEAIGNLHTLPAPATVTSFVAKEEANLLSPTVELHSPMPKTAEQMICATAGIMRLPWNMEHLHYASTLTAAMLHSDIVKHHRAEGNECMSAVCRQLNDSWPAVSPAMIDYYGRKKAQMHLAADFCAPITVCAKTEGSAVTFWVINERRSAFSGLLTYSLYDAKGECLFEARRDVVLTQMSVTMPIYEDMSRLTAGIEDSVIISWELRDDHGIVSEGARTVVPYKHFAFVDCEIRTEITGMGRKFVLKLDADAFVGGVYLSLEDMNATFSKNYFDYLGITPIQITVETTDVTVPATLMKKLRIIRASDIGK